MTSAKNVDAIFEKLATPGTYPENNPLVKISGKWSRSPDSRDSGGLVWYTTNGPASATLTFKGTGVRWITRMARGNGIAGVYIDGTLERSVDGYSASPRYNVRAFDSGTLANGVHSVRIAYTGRKRAAASNDTIVVDSFVVR